MVKEAYRPALVAGAEGRKARKLVAMIPARGGSKGLIMKNLQHIAGYPMLAHSILALKVAGIDDVWVSTEDRKIKKCALTYGAKVLDRPEELAMDESPTESVIDHFLSCVPSDIVIMLQCTSPMLQPRSIKKGLSRFYDCEYDSLFSVVKAHDTLIWDYRLRPWNYDPDARGRRQTRSRPTYIESGGYYIFTRKMFLRKKCRIGGRTGISEVEHWQSFQVDSKRDIQMIRKLMRAEREY